MLEQTIIQASFYNSKGNLNSVRKRRSVSERRSLHSRKKSSSLKKSHRSQKSPIPFHKLTISRPPNLDLVKQKNEYEIFDDDSEEQFIVSQGVTYENQVNPRTNHSADNSISLGDQNSSHIESNQKIPEERKDDNTTSNGKSEIVIDSKNPNKTQDTKKPKINGKPIGMQFLYQADKLTCVVKCHTKEHLEEAQNRVSSNVCFSCMA